MGRPAWVSADARRTSRSFGSARPGRRLFRPARRQLADGRSTDRSVPKDRAGDSGRSRPATVFRTEFQSVRSTHAPNCDQHRSGWRVPKRPVHPADHRCPTVPDQSALHARFARKSRNCCAGFRELRRLKIDHVTLGRPLVTSARCPAIRPRTAEASSLSADARRPDAAPAEVRPAGRLPASTTRWNQTARTRRCRFLSGTDPESGRCQTARERLHANPTADCVREPATSSEHAMANPLRNSVPEVNRPRPATDPECPRFRQSAAKRDASADQPATAIPGQEPGLSAADSAIHPASLLRQTDHQPLSETRDPSADHQAPAERPDETRDAFSASQFSFRQSAKLPAIFQFLPCRSESPHATRPVSVVASSEELSSKP